MYLFLELFGWLLVGHALADYPLQTDFMAKGKNWKTPVPGVPWYYIMAAHCLVHAGCVALITHSAILACAEFVLHFFLDCAKCDGVTNIHLDQAGHIVCKLGWAYAVLTFV